MAQSDNSSLPDKMTILEVTPKETEGDAPLLQMTKTALPTPKDDEVLIQTAFCGINRPDILQRKGLYPAPKTHSPLLGLEASGTIVALGANVSKHKIGDQVTALLNGGGYATYCTAHEGHCLPIPAGLGLREAASLPETVFTVWHNVFERGQLKAGDWFLIHGGTSGIGVMAIQMAKALGANVIATAGSDEKCTACQELGADLAINYNKEDFVPLVKDTCGGGFDVCLDMVGGDYIARNIKAAAPDGRIVQIAFLKGSKVEINLMSVMLKRLTFTGSTLRTRSDKKKAQLRDDILRHIWPLIDEQKIRPVVHSTYEFAKANKAHAFMESNQHIGKLILQAPTNS